MKSEQEDKDKEDRHTKNKEEPPDTQPEATKPPPDPLTQGGPDMQENKHPATLKAKEVDRYRAKGLNESQGFQTGPGHSMTPEDVPGELAKERQRDSSQQYKGGQDNTRVLDDTKTRGRKDRKQGRDVGRPMSESPARPRSGHGRPMGGVRGR